MSFSLLPNLRAEAVTQLTQEYLQSQAISLLMLDFDNTIVPYTTSTPTEQMDAWLKKMAASSIKVCVVSNSRKDRVKIFCQKYGIDCITHAKKPFSKGIRQCLRRYGVEPHCSALAGDQIFTDTLGANCAGVKSILVRAIDNHTIWLKLRHVAEMPFILASLNRRLPYDKS